MQLGKSQNGEAAEAIRFLAHLIPESGKEQTLLAHLLGTARLAGEFGAAFDAGDEAALMGRYHDIGKYSYAFQKYLRSGGKCGKVDHSTAGMQEFFRAQNVPAAFCVGGHHAGLPNRGNKMDGESGNTFYAKSKRKNLPDYQMYASENPPIPQISRTELEKLYQRLSNGCDVNFSMMFYIRMLYSCLVDADYLDTEAFMTGKQRETSGFEKIAILKEHFDAYVEEYFSHPKSAINQKRWELLQQCITAGEKQAVGLQNLTIPTGGGKTIASLGFALHAAQQHHKERIIYVIPYTSIIEQSAAVFRRIVGEKNVVEHHMNVVYDMPDDEENAEIVCKRLATENWDAPVIVTTNVQFFESLFANRASRCRKLHNIANSVLIFDEAQMLPVDFLRPCTRVIQELTERYGCMAVLCTATQPSLDSFFADERLAEICPDLEVNYNFFKRTKLIALQEVWDIDDLADRLAARTQVLCIVNTKKHAVGIFEAVQKRCGAGVYHLSTNLCAADRSSILDQVRAVLKEGKPCRLIATSLVEAGVDVDFPSVYRELAGLDSILQAAGRGNREGKRSLEDSCVYIFELTDTLKSRQIQLEQQIMKMLLNNEELREHLDSPQAIQWYFDNLHTYRGSDFLDHKSSSNAGILEMSGYPTIPFADIAKEFVLIDTPQRPVYIPKEENIEITAQLQQGRRNRTLLRVAGKYMVNVYDNVFESLRASGAIEVYDEMVAILVDVSKYDNAKGLNQNVEAGQGIMM